MKSLKVTLTLWLTLFFVFVMLALAIGLGIQESRHMSRDLSMDLGQAVQIVSRIILDKQRDAFGYFSRVAAKMPGGLMEAEAYIEKIGQTYLPIESTFYLLDANGEIIRVFRDSLKPYLGLSLSNLEDVQSVVTSHRASMSGVYVSPFTGERVVAMNFPSPHGWILRVEIVTDLFLNFVRDIQETLNYRLIIFNKQGDILVHPDQRFPGDIAGLGLMADRWTDIKEATGKVFHFHLMGEKVVGIFKSLDPFGLNVGIIIPESFISRQVYYSVAMLGWMGLVALLLLSAVNFWMILHAVIHPLEEISSRVNRYEVGKSGTMLPLSLGRGFSEMGLLINGFNRMATRIHTHMREIARLESMIRNILDSSPAIVVAVGPDGRIWYMNRSGESFFGVSSEEISGKRLRELDPDLESYEEKIEEVMVSGSPLLVRSENWLKGSMVDGAIYPLAANESDGAVIQWLDVSEKYRAREAYRKRLEEIFSQMDDLIYVVNEAYKIEIMNEKMAKRSGGDWYNLPCYKVVRKRAEVCSDCQFPDVKKGKVVRERIHSAQDGRFYDVTSMPLVNEDGSISKLTIHRDVTEFVMVQEALKSSEAAFRSLFEGAPVGMSVHQDGKFVMVNETLARMLQYTPRELIGTSILKIIHPDDQAFVKRRIEKLYEERELAPVAREKYIARNGKLVEVLVTGIPTTYRGRPAVHTVVIDLTEQIRLQTSLLRSEAFSAQILEKALDPILLLEPRTLKILEANRPAIRFFGLQHDEIVGRSYYEFVYPEDLDEIEKSLETLDRKGFINVTGRRLNLSGGERTVDMGVVRVKTPEGEDRDVAFVKDLTEFVALQRRFAQAQKQESLWQMAGGFAHDFNNLLAIMFGYLDMMEMTNDPGRCETYIRKLREISIRARDLVQNILLFSRENRGELKRYTVHEVVVAALNLIRPALGSKIDLRVEVRNPEDVVLVDMSQMVQVVLNLSLNARDAIGEDTHGVVSLKTRRQMVRTKDAALLEIPPGPYVEICVEDTGKGIPEEIMDKVFDPFFTTKSKGARKGTGLGLAIVQSIIKNIGGAVNFRTSPQGTIFCVLIPLKEKGRDRPKEGDREVLVKGKGRILIVEDEKTLQIILKEMLEELGYGVEVAGDGRDAVEKLETRHKEFDLVILDLAMPRMGGEEILERLMRIRPDLKVIIMSGMVDKETQKRLLKKGAIAFVGKPVTISKLSRIIYQAMQRQ